MPSIQRTGVNFQEPWLLTPTAPPVANMNVYDSGSTIRAASTTAFFTELARRGVQDTTNWTASTYKTILSVSGKGLVAGYVGCTSGGAETHTVELTVDGVLTEIVIPVSATGRRATLTVGNQSGVEYTTPSNASRGAAEELNAAKTVFDDTQGAGTGIIAPWWFYVMNGNPMLQFNASLLIRAKHSTDITNSTATAYSAVMYRKGL